MTRLLSILLLSITIVACKKENENILPPSVPPKTANYEVTGTENITLTNIGAAMLNVQVKKLSDVKLSVKSYISNTPSLMTVTGDRKDMKPNYDLDIKLQNFFTPVGDYTLSFNTEQQGDEDRNKTFNVTVTKSDDKDCQDFFWEHAKEPNEDKIILKGKLPGAFNLDGQVLEIVRDSTGQLFLSAFQTGRGMNAVLYSSDYDKGYPIYVDCNSRTITLPSTQLYYRNYQGLSIGTIQGSGTIMPEEGKFTFINNIHTNDVFTGQLKME